MRHNTFIFACLCSAAAVAFVSAVPIPANNQELDVLQIPLSNGKEIDVLTVGAKDQEQQIADRNRRTVGLLRELFPDITKQIDSIVNRIIAQVIRVLGPSLLPALLGNRPQTTTPNGFDADFDDDDFNDIDTNSNDKNEVINNKDTKKPNSNEEGVKVKIDLPTFPPTTKDTTDADAKNVSSTTQKSTTTPTTTSTASTTTTSSTTSTSTTTTTTTTTSTTPTIPTTFRIPEEPMTTVDSIMNLNKPIKTTPILIDPYTTPSTLLSTYTSFYPVQYTSTLDPINETIKSNSSTTATTDEATSTNLYDSLENSSEAIDVDEAQLVARIVSNLNRLLTSSNYFITTRDNLTTTTTTTTTPTPSTTTSTVKITKLFPNGATDTQIDLSAINKQLEETIRVARQVKEAEAAASQAQQQQAPTQLPIPQSPSAKPLPEQTVQLSFNNEVSPLPTNDNSKPVNNELQSTESKSPAIDELTLDSNEDTTDLDDRNKRFLSFGGAGLMGGGAGNGAAGGAASGGSGNFLFDIVRLFSGSVQTQTGDEAANSANSVSGSSDTDADSDANRAADGYTEGIPGPVTRLVVLANRGLANLIQDLILRIAATSEKFVNFKAKLITALI